MTSLIKDILNIKKSKSYSEYINYHRDNLLGIMKTSRRELPHSDFIAWILNPQYSDVGLFPIVQFVHMLNFALDRPENTKSRSDVSVLNRFFDDNFIVDASVEREVDNIDLVITITTAGKVLPIIVENKVDSSENGKNKDQTNVYFSKSESKYGDKSKYYDPLYVYLHPEFNNCMQANPNYIRVSYQDLVDFVIEPVLYRTKDPKKISNINTYLQSLSIQEENEKGDKVMALSAEEKKIIDNFVEENKDLLINVINSLSDEIDEKAKSALTSAIKDNTKYAFEGGTYKKSRLVLSVIKKLVEDEVKLNPNLKFDSFLKKYEKLQSKKVHGTYPLFDEKQRIQDAKKGIGGKKVYFVDEAIKLPSGEEILVCNQWGIGNIGRFLDIAKEYGCSITEIK